MLNTNKGDNYMGNNQGIISPRIQSLCAELEIDREIALKTFWDEVSTNGFKILLGNN